ncbi:hypothetical protein ACES2J_08375 [Bdellovibrio bacteriovorus]|uniref:hypothetical protein n=1 Tax=Bdellovibrio bacteriovorus TaxID=959 RepID=UPI0035A5FB95
MSKPKFNPNKAFEAAGKPKFDPNAKFDVFEETSELESALRGLAQGGSFGFADEITGGIEALLSGKSYEQARDESRAAYQAAQEANPISFGAGEIGGAVGTAFIPGLGALNAGKAASFAGRAGLAAGQGALTGLGQSEATEAKDMLLDSAKGAAIGAVAQGVGEKVLAPAFSKVSNALSKADDATNWTLKKTGKVLANIPEEYSDRYMKNPEAVRNAMSREDLAASLLDETGGMGQLKDKIALDDWLAWNELDTNTVIPKTEFLDDALNTLKKDILDPNDTLSRTSGFGASDQKLGAIEKELDKINQAFGKTMSESDLKAIIQDLRKVAYSYEGSPKYTHQGEGLRDLANYFDQVLKGGNKEYEKLMGPVADKTRLLKDLERNFINKQDTDSYDKFISKVSRWQNADDASSIKRSLGALDDITGTSISDDIDNTLTREAFSKADTNGSRKTMFGTVIGGGAGSIVGGPVGGLIGGAIGGAAGQIGDKYAGVIFKNILDGKIAAGKGLQYLAPKLGKYSAPLMEAAKRGNRALAATHFILSQRDPEYRKLMEEEK